MADQGGNSDPNATATKAMMQELMVSMKTMVQETVAAALAARQPDEYSYANEGSVAAEEQVYTEEQVYAEEGDDVEFTDSASTHDTEVMGRLNAFAAPGDQKAEKQIVEPSESILQRIKDAMATEEQGENLSEAVAEICSLLVEKGLSEEKLMEIEKKHLPPGNCQALAPTKVNQVVWNIISPNTRSADLVSQRVQTKLAKAMTALAKGMDELKEASKMVPSLGSMFGNLTDAFTLMASVNRDINNKRRDTIKPDLAPAYKHICSTSVPITSMLFGDNVEDVIKSQADANKLKVQIAGNRGSHSNSRANRGKVTKPYQQTYNSNRGHRRPGNHQGFRRGQSQPRGRGRGQRGRQ
jgi:plastocyanin